MEKLIVNNYDEFAAYLGKNLGVSEWVELPQERINQFADATLDTARSILEEAARFHQEVTAPLNQFDNAVLAG